VTVSTVVYCNVTTDNIVVLLLDLADFFLVTTLVSDVAAF